MNFRKGQAALDFLMTYGGAIALVVIIADVLFALGIFDVSNFIGSRAAGFSGVAVKGWKLSPAGDLTVKVTNEVGQLITINSVNATIGANSSLNSTSIPLAVGEDSPDIVLGGFSPQTAGTGYTAKVVISYTDRSSDFDYSSSGTLTGKATE